jgi:hypothetical protein
MTRGIKAKGSTWIETLTMALPMNAALKKVVNGTKKCPQRKPARSNRGLGTYRVK